MDDSDSIHLVTMNTDRSLDLGNMNADPTSTWMDHDGDPRLEDLVGDFTAPIVELTNSDLTELKDVEMDEPDFGLLEPAVEISSPASLAAEACPAARDDQDRPVARDDEDSSEDSFCMIEPEVGIHSPGRGESPEFGESPEVRECSPDARDYSSDVQPCSPSARGDSPDGRDDSPELVRIEDSQDRPGGDVDRSLFEKYRLQKLEISLVRIDHTLAIADNSVVLPSSLAGEPRRPTAIPRGSKAKARHDRATTAPYALRKKPEPAAPETVRLNPYALQKSTAKTSALNSRRIKTEEPDNDFSPTDFLETTMDVGNDSPVKPKPWQRNSEGTAAFSLAGKDVVLLRKKQPNGSAVAQGGRPAGGATPNASVQRIMAKSDSLAEKEMLSKVLSNSSISLTAQRSKLQTAIEGGQRPSPGSKKPAVLPAKANNNNQYANRLSNENVARLESQVQTLQAQVQTLQAKLAAANNYIVTSLQGTFKPQPPPPPQPPLAYRPRSQAQPRGQLRQTAPSFKPHGVPRGLVPFRSRHPPPLAQPRHRQVAPTRGRGQARPILPARVVPFRARGPPVAAMQPMTVFPMRTSTQALTVIPMPSSRKPPFGREAERDAVLPSFEQVNVNERFGTHFLTE